MEVINTDFYTHIKPSKDSLKKSENIIEFYNDFNKNYTNFKNDNIILDFSENLNLDLKEILLFLQLSNEHIYNNKSFVIIANKMSSDLLIIVPTLKEAEDIIELEEIERDLGI